MNTVLSGSRAYLSKSISLRAFSTASFVQSTPINTSDNLSIPNSLRNLLLLKYLLFFHFQYQVRFQQHHEYFVRFYSFKVIVPSFHSLAEKISSLIFMDFFHFIICQNSCICYTIFLFHKFYNIIHKLSTSTYLSYLR